MWFLWFMQGFTCTNLPFILSNLLALFPCSSSSSSSFMWLHSVSFFSYSHFTLSFFSCCAVFAAIVLCPSPGLRSSPPLCRSVSSFLSHTHSSVCVRIVWVCTNGRESVRLAGRGLRGLAARCVQCERLGREEEEEEGKSSSRLGSGESSDGVRGCFCFEMAGFETRRGASRLSCRRHARLIGPGCSSLPAPQALAGRAPKRSLVL